MTDTTTALPVIGSRCWRDLISSETGATVLSQGASARPRQLLAQGRESFLLSPLHRHGADLQLLCSLPE
jgi:hypothetical protein